MITKPRFLTASFTYAAMLLISSFIIFSSCSSPPTKTFHIVNTGTEARSITLQLIKDDGSIEDLYTLNKVLNPGEQVWEQIENGKYFASIWNAEDKLVQELDTVNALLEGDKSNFNPIVIDLALDKNFALANINYLYEGGAIADMISGAVGADQTSLKIIKLYSGAQAFEVEAKYRGGVQFVDIFTSKLQKTVAAGAIVYALVPISAEITDKSKALEVVHKNMLSKLTQE